MQSSLNLRLDKSTCQSRIVTALQGLFQARDEQNKGLMNVPTMF